MKFKVFFFSLVLPLALLACMPAPHKPTVYKPSTASRATNCNVYVIEEMQRIGIPFAEARANTLDRYLDKSYNWQKVKRKKGKLDHESAHEAAKNGGVVLVTYNTKNRQSGHIAILDGSKQLYWSSSYNAHIPYVSGSVKGKRPKIMPLSKQFAASKEPKMNYYIYVGGSGGNANKKNKK
jgi:hypothetical protein